MLPRNDKWETENKNRTRNGAQKVPGKEMLPNLHYAYYAH
jgi:hypothetical protein